MATIYRAVGGRRITKVLAVEAGVQDELARRAFEMAARAAANLAEHRSKGDAAIDIEHGDVDWYVILSDERGQKAALSIEYGRAAHIDPVTGETKDAMDGLFILHDATHLPRQHKGRVRF